MRILRSYYVNLSKKWFLLGWFICQPLFYCDQASIGFDESLISRTAAFGAHKIGDLQKPTDGSTPISGVVHKSLHTANGAVLGALTAAATWQDVGMGAAGGLVGSILTDAMVDDKDIPVTVQHMTQMSEPRLANFICSASCFKIVGIIKPFQLRLFQISCECLADIL
jgi:hypothetical protein